MPRTHRFSILAILLVLCFAFAAVSTGEPESSTTLAAGDGLQWYKGNLHTHSHWSDGDDYLEMIALWYKERDYDFLCFTDHNVLANTERWVEVDKTKGGRTAYDKLKARFPDWIEEREGEGGLEVRLRTFAEVSEKIAEPGKYLLIQGEEISDRFDSHPIHLNASNIQEVIPPIGGDSVLETMQNNVNAVIAQRERTGQPILVHLNHPNFGYAITAEELMRVVGENFFEVYNGHPSVHNSGDHVHASTERIWDVILTWRITELDLPLMYGLAVDDGHEYHNIPSRASEPGRGWVVVLAEELTPDALIDSLEAGRFYASSGVDLKRVSSSPTGLKVEVDAEEGVEYTIDFIGTRRGFDSTSEEKTDDDGNPIRTTRSYSDDVGELLQSTTATSAEYHFTGDELYVRARITSTREHPNPAEPGEFERAWSQPILGPAANRNPKKPTSP
ncbi:MAG: hypothetical protein DWQ34_01420 [Planctomycetota bacterium]|nr:MAG: hypothetical protein DWQ34_01420 [Planctomycetota bacterium]REK26654.1 MAG: hypothetical protein DWQ41_08860 [Planctomycetota bacterium]REK35687.1 MAG: hypothetical protein DWQ45_11095 [Planctomycetota bacterium]